MLQKKPKKKAANKATQKTLQKSSRAIFLKGHRKEEQRLRKLYEKGKIGQGWIFSGHKGIGKAALAYKLICFLYSKNTDKIPHQNENLDIKQDANIYHKLDGGAIRDCLIIDQESEENKKQIIIPAAKIRKINKFFSNHSSIGLGNKRVCIIDEADKMTREACNAMLKILEEPPQDVLFILIAHNYYHLPVTIRSRCYHLGLRPIGENDMKNFLENNQDKQMDEEIKSKIIKYAKGIPAKALFIADNYEFQQKIDDILQDMPKINIDKVKNLADKTEANNENNIEYFQHINDCIANFIYELLSKQICDKDDIKISQNISLRFHSHLERAVELHLEILRETNTAIRLYQNKPLLVYDLFNRLRQVMQEKN